MHVTDVADFAGVAFASLPDLIRQHATTQPAHLALIQDDDSGLIRIDYATLDRRLDAIAAHLQGEGVEAGDTVAACAPNSIALALLFLGTLRAGADIAPLSPSSTPESLAKMPSPAPAPGMSGPATAGRISRQTAR